MQKALPTIFPETWIVFVSNKKDKHPLHSHSVIHDVNVHFNMIYIQMFQNQIEVNDRAFQCQQLPHPQE